MKRKIWLPLLTIGATTAVVVPAITSCRPGLMGTHDMLDPNYIHHVIPESERTIAKDLMANEYLKSVNNNTDVLKDDILYTYSKVLTYDKLKANLDFDFTRYFLYVDDIKVDLDNSTIEFILWSEITGTTKAAKQESHKYDEKYLRDFTLVIGAKISTPFDNITVEAKQTDEPFKDAIKFVVTNSKIDSATYRTYMLGTIGLSDTATSSTITQKAISVDETALYSSKTQNITLVNDLVYSIPYIAIQGGTWAGQIIVESYYFKNVKFTA